MEDWQAAIRSTVIALVVIWVVMAVCLWWFWGPVVWALTVIPVLYTGFMVHEEIKFYRGIKNIPIKYARQKEWAEKAREQLLREHWGDTSLAAVAEIEAYLQKLCDSFIWLFNGMPKVEAHLINKPIHDTDGVVRSHIHLDNIANPCLAVGGSGKIWIKKEHFEKANYDELVRTIKHEMTHCWTQWLNIEKDDPHGPEFRKKLEEVMRA